MREFIRKSDIILLIALLVLGFAVMGILGSRQSEDASDAKVVIKSGGDIFAAYSLKEDRVIEVPSPYDGQYNIVTIQNGKVIVSEASCKNQLCVKHGAISHSGESLVCLPNRLMVSIEGLEGGGYDSITS